MRALLGAISIVFCVAVAACGADDDGGGDGEEAEGEEFVREAAQDLSTQEKRDFTDAVLELKRMPPASG